MLLNKTISKNNFSKNNFPKNNFSKNNISIYDIILSSSIVSNFFCFQYILKQNEQISELIEKNKSLVDSINKLNNDVAKMGEDILIMHTKAAANPIMINTSASGSDFYLKTLLITGLIATGAVTTYYLSSLMIAKISSLSLYNPLALSKFFSLNTILTNLPFNLPFLDQKKEISVFLQELSVTLFIEFMNGEISSINFRQVDDENLTPIKKALEAYFKLQSSNENNKDLPSVVEAVETISKGELLSVTGSVAEAANNLSNLSNLF
jgi:hypothetical protein